jgi:DNA-binding Lrp family transcriptional regulator
VTVERRFRGEDPMKAYVLIQADGNGEPLADKLATIPEILAAQDLSGAYDAIALAWSGSERELMDRVIAEIRKLPGVTHALPAPLANSSSDGSRVASADQNGHGSERAA